jgi:ribonuclease HI
MGNKNKYYSVARGRKTGIFSAWYGPNGAEAQILGYAGARYKGFATIEEAREWLALITAETENKSTRKTAQHIKTNGVKTVLPDHELAAKSGKVLIYTDGGCRYNPGPGGYGAAIISGKARKEISGGFRLTTNNRMELTACIEALKVLKKESTVIVCSDSKYIVDAVTKGWARKWRKNGWMRNKTDYTENYDLWEQLLDLCEKHHVDFVWVKGHAGTLENERCDQLATGAAAGKNLSPDKAYESGATRVAPI